MNLPQKIDAPSVPQVHGTDDARAQQVRLVQETRYTLASRQSGAADSTHYGRGMIALAVIFGLAALTQSAVAIMAAVSFTCALLAWSNHHRGSRP